MFSWNVFFTVAFERPKPPWLGGSRQALDYGAWRLLYVS